MIYLRIYSDKKFNIYNICYSRLAQDLVGIHLNMLLDNQLLAPGEKHIIAKISLIPHQAS